MHHVLRIGHRGAAGHAPENTLAAIQRGIELEADFVEIDVRCTADGVLVALHDATVNRTTNGKGRVDSLSLPEIRALDAGNGEHIPTLEQVLKVAAAKTGLMFFPRILRSDSTCCVFCGSLIATVTVSPSELSAIAPTWRAMSTGSCS